jgi:addiction module RelE/StbE family toxin
VINAVWDESFKRSYRKKIRRQSYLKKKFWERMEIFLEEPYNSQLRTHKLSGKLVGQWAFSIDDEYRVIFEFIDPNTVLLIDFGKHDEVY